MTVRGYVPGVFDLFHIGHLRIFQRAREACDVLIAGVVTDEVARAAKGRPPVIPFDERFEIVSSLRLVDEVVIDEHVEKAVDVAGSCTSTSCSRAATGRAPRKVIALEAALAEFGARVHYFPYTETTSSTLLRAFISKH